MLKNFKQFEIEKTKKNLVKGEGQPGGNSVVNLRGVGSINGDTDPLFIID